MHRSHCSELVKWVPLATRESETARSRFVTQSLVELGAIVWVEAITASKKVKKLLAVKVIDKVCLLNVQGQYNDL